MNSAALAGGRANKLCAALDDSRGIGDNHEPACVLPPPRIRYAVTGRALLTLDAVALAALLRQQVRTLFHHIRTLDQRRQRIQQRLHHELGFRYAQHIGDVLRSSETDGEKSTETRFRALADDAGESWGCNVIGIP